MSNTYNTTTKKWKVDSTGTLNTGGITIKYMYFVPNNAGDQIEITDNADNAWLHLWADPGAANPKFIPFDPPHRMPSLKIATLSSGSILTIQLKD